MEWTFDFFFLFIYLFEQKKMFKKIDWNHQSFIFDAFVKL
jgi:hypothetical protein